MKKDIYIIKNSVNSKVYIGQATDAAKRWLSHIYNAKYEAKTNKEVQVLHKAMAKYGIDKFHYEILEHQVPNYDERECYWIRYYNSTVPNGYNVAPGGGGSGSGLNSSNAIFKTHEELMACIYEISSTTKTFANIAKKFRCSPEVIVAINNGYRYKQDGLVYPLRAWNRYTQETIKQVMYSLKYELDLSLKNIAEKYDIDQSQVSAINQGSIYVVKGQSYPLRKHRKSDLDDQTQADIIDDIINSQLSLSEIATKYNISRTRISGINQGVYYKRENLDYPIRGDKDERNKSFKKYLSVNDIKDIHELLKTNLSIREIAAKCDVSSTTIRNVNNGVCKKYHLDGVKYPVRKIKSY